MNDTYPKIVMVEAVLMENGEVIHFGKTLGFINEGQRKIVESEATKLAKNGQMVVALGDNVA